MSWLVASTERTDVAVVRDTTPALWRELRRFNAPIQLAVAAAHEVATSARVPAEAALVSLAPCQSGSPEIHHWVHMFETGGAVRPNPTHTLHIVDNLALSVLALGLGNHAYGLSLGGAPGMLWVGLELVGERLELEREVIVLGGDQEASERAGSPQAFALLFARERTAWGPRGRAVQLVAVERRRAATPVAPAPHAAAGARAMIAALDAQPPGRFSYVAPAAHGDGTDDVTIIWELE